MTSFFRLSFLLLAVVLMGGCTLTEYTLEKAKKPDFNWKYSYKRPAITYVKNAYLAEEYLSLCMNVQMDKGQPSKEYSYKIQFDELSKYVSQKIVSDVFTVYEVDNLHFSAGCRIPSGLKSLPIEEITPQQIKKFKKNIAETKLFLVKKSNAKQNYLAFTSVKPILGKNNTIILRVKKIKKINGVSIDTGFLWYGAVPFAIVGDAAIIAGYIVASGCMESNCSGGF
ncbi:hypothetical protein KCM76_23440 [Zooshikella marina]|uniref:hypothetical protein n=1 Tax=Zooshikella ganghwensis TaxID=202772 RepID=UPI001BAF5EB2|nr:hypothetical protein [Zooshikella ganghwensis]MBU2708969.1 hypothetical protein [Zooshikella ganghwensis]